MDRLSNASSESGAAARTSRTRISQRDLRRLG